MAQFGIQYSKSQNNTLLNINPNHKNISSKTPKFTTTLFCSLLFLSNIFPFKKQLSRGGHYVEKAITLDTWLVLKVMGTFWVSCTFNICGGKRSKKKKSGKRIKKSSSRRKCVSASELKKHLFSFLNSGNLN